MQEGKTKKSESPREVRFRERSARFRLRRPAQGRRRSDFFERRRCHRRSSIIFWMLIFFFRFILFFSSEWSDCNRSLSFGTRPNLLTILETLVGSLETAVCCETEWESLSGLLQSRAEPSGALEGHCRLGDDQNSLAEKTSLRFTKQTGDRWMKN